ncbi:helix-turn-helix transcriptional regulator [Cognatiyoonia sp. IB215182]|uniref:helix-turn-helix domain-containing protein n=1 Tax=Cognatiyoonia sp. IB215182 TaxID=3097353 RepID=UPI002A1375C2|nr:helix-turn-helix transcriptional regulator [Cognatiyoonia sp. IB215182]MDX8355577.1 helix-turn-helix transcriptional regulator [Cognatiyoonia sp. IB215182]
MDQKPDAALIKYRLRSEADLTLKLLAERLDCHPSTISMVINGRRKSAPIMNAIFEILDSPTSSKSDDVVRQKLSSKEDAA